MTPTPFQLQVSEVELLLNDMVSLDLKPSCFTLTILIRMYGKSKSLDKALSLAKRLPKQFGFEMDAKAYTALVGACVVCGNVQSAVHIFTEMTATKGLDAPGRAYHTVIWACLNVGGAAGFNWAASIVEIVRAGGFLL